MVTGDELLELERGGNLVTNMASDLGKLLEEVHPYGRTSLGVEAVYDHLRAV